MKQIISKDILVNSDEIGYGVSAVWSRIDLWISGRKMGGSIQNLTQSLYYLDLFLWRGFEEDPSYFSIQLRG
jgi:hypothetical protein